MRGIAIFVLLAVCGVASPQARPQGWTVEVVDSNTIGAYTINDSGGVFGKLCFVSSAKCIWIISAAAPCENSGTYAALSNSVSGAFLHTLTCFGDKKLGQLLTFSDYAALEKISNNDNLVGFAIPMLDGQFRVMRFSLEGSVAACTKAEQAVLDAEGKSTADFNL